MTEKEIRSWMLDEELPDQWWISLDDQTQEEPVSLQEAAESAAKEPEREVQVLHVSRVGDKEPPWVIVDADSAMSPEEREKLKSSKITFGIGVTVQLCVLLIIAGVVAYFIWPNEQRRSAYNIIDGYNPDVLLEGLNEVDPEALQENRSLSTTVARTKRLLYIINKTDRTWTQCAVTLNETDGFAFVHEGEIPPEKTLTIPLRKFSREGESYTAVDQPITRIFIDVPGFQTYDKAFEPNSP
ncbi:MAG: hypothetical protein AAGA45_01010 [Verrucomicrobiota bacterium]